MSIAPCHLAKRAKNLVRKFANLSMVLISLLLALPAFANEANSASPSHKQTLKAFTAKYSAILNGSSVNGTAVRQLQFRPNGQATFSFMARVNIAKLTEESLLGWDQCTPVPQTYQRSLRVFFRNKKQSIHFDQNKLQANYTDDKKSGQADIPAKTQDRISLQLALRCDLLNGKQQGSYTVFDSNKLKTYQFKVTGEEIIDTPIGKLTATKVQLQRENSDRQTWLWFSKQHDYLLIKLKQSESSSESLEITISEFKGT